MLNDFTWNMTGYIPKYQVNPHGDGIIPYVAERIFQGSCRVPWQKSWLSIPEL